MLIGPSLSYIQANYNQLEFKDFFIRKRALQGSLEGKKPCQRIENIPSSAGKKDQTICNNDQIGVRGCQIGTQKESHNTNMSRQESESEAFLENYFETKREQLQLFQFNHPLAVTLLCTASPFVISKFCTIGKLSRFVNRNESEISYNPELLHQLLTLYKNTLGNLTQEQSEHVQSDLSKFWNFLQMGNQFEVAGSTFVLLLSEIVAIFDGQFISVLIHYLQEPKNLKMGVVFQCLARVLGCNLKNSVSDENWAKVFKAVREIFKELQGKQSNRRGITQAGVIFCKFVDSLVDFISECPYADSLAVREGLELFLDDTINQLIFRLLKRYNNLRIMSDICDLLLRFGYFYKVESILQRILTYNVQCAKDLKITTLLLQQHPKWSEEWAGRIFSGSNILVAQIFIQSREGMLVFNELMKYGSKLFADGEEIFHYIVNIGYGRMARQYADDPELMRSVEELMEIIVVDPTPMLNAIYDRQN